MNFASDTTAELRMMHKLLKSATCATLLLSLFCGMAQAQPEKNDVYFARQIWTGQGIIENGAMHVVDGRIVKIGPRSEMSVPPMARRHDLGSQVIIPGIFAANSTLGGTQSEEKTLTPHIQALDGFDFFADRSKLLKVGITSAHIAPGTDRLMPGQGAVVQLSGDVADGVVAEQDSLHIILTAAARRPPRIYEPPVGPVSEDRPLETTRPQVATLPTQMAVLRQLFRQATQKQPTEGLAATLSEVIKSGRPIRVSASTSAEIRSAIELAKTYKFKVILDQCIGLDAFENAFDSWNDVVAGVILVAPQPGKITNPSIDNIEAQKTPWKFVRQMLDANIPVAVRAASDNDLTQIMFATGLFMQGGMTAEEALASITSTPAKLCGVGDQVGRLAAGCRADFVTLTDPPFQLNSKIMQTFVAGESRFKTAPAPETTLVRASKVYVGDGKFESGNVVVKGKTIRGVGSDVSTPAGANVKDFGDAYIVPGFVDMGATLGFDGAFSGSASLATKLGDQLFPGDPAVEYARKHGITTALLKAGNGAATPVVAFKLGDDVRVIGEPVAIRFRFAGATAAALAANEKLLKAGKAYADSWIKYEKDLAEYKVKKAEADKKKASEKKPAAKEEKKEPAKKEDSEKKSDKKSDSSDKPKKETPEKKPTPKKEDKEKETEKEKEGKEKPKKEKPLPDPITGTWEGEIVQERIPPQLRVIKMELVLEKNDISGTISFFRQNAEIESGSFDRASKTVELQVSIRNNEIPITGKLDENGDLKAKIKLGPNEAEIVASRTVDKSKKPEPEEEEKKDPEKDKPKPDKDKPKPDQPDKDKPAPEKDKPKPEDKKEKPADKDDKKEAEKKDEKKDEEADKKKAEVAKKPAEPTLKEPKKPRANPALEPYRELLTGKIPAIVEVSNLYSIKAAAELFSKTYKVRTILVGVNDLARDPELLKDFDVTLVAGPTMSVTIDKNDPTNMPQLFATEQFKFGFQSNGTTGSGQLPAAVQFAIASGLSKTDALNGLTQNPSEMLSDKMTFGRIAPGKDADLVVLSGPPFEFSTKVLAVMVDGKWVYEGDQENE